MADANQSSLIDIVIPVYSGLDAVRRCIDSVLASANSTPFELVIVDDASPEPEISAWLRSLEHPGLTLLVNEENQGFVGSVNRAAREHPDRDFIILNADTEVADGWVDRLVASATRNPDAATVTPFSNNGSIASFPAIDKENPLPGDTSLAQLAELFGRVNEQQDIEIPVGVGFCLWVRRAAWRDCDGFDAAFGRGYGEEVDFCMSAAAKGWRHVLAADVFVFHEGSVSFGRDEVPALQASAQRIIDDRYPDFPELVTEFYTADPLAEYRLRAIVGLVATQPAPRVLMISHSWGGGVQKHVNELAALLRDTQVANSFILQPTQGEQGAAATLSWLDGSGTELVTAPLLDTSDQWQALLQSLGFSRLHYHHVVEFPQWILDLPNMLSVPYQVTLHDFWPVCPQFHFVTRDDEYCGRPDMAGCQACLAERPDQWGLGIEAWRGLFDRWLASAEVVIAPTQSVASIVGDYLPSFASVVRAHPEVPAGKGASAAQSQQQRKIAVLGSLTPLKGLAALESVIWAAVDAGADIHFSILGAPRRALFLPPGASVSIHGSFQESELPALLRSERLDGFWFASLVPETYGYALTTAMQTGLPILATDLGAFTERLANYPKGHVIPPEATAEAVLDALLKLGSPYELIASTSDAMPTQITPEDYATAYGVGLPTEQPALMSDEAVAALSKMPVAELVDDTVGLPMVRLLELAIDCRDRSAIDYLTKRTIAEERELVDVKAQRLREADEVMHLKGVIGRLRDAHEKHADELKQRIHAQLETLDARDAELTKLGGYAKSLAGELENVRDQLARESAQLEAACVRITELESYEAHLLSELDRERAFIGELTQSVVAKDQQLAAQANRIHEFETSTFWRMTAPLRAIAARLKRVTELLVGALRRVRRFAVFLRYHYSLGGFSGLLAAVRRRLGRRSDVSVIDAIGSHSIGKPTSQIPTERPPAIALDLAEAPALSIVIPSYGEHEVTRQCLASIAEHPPGVPYEVIVADDAFERPFDVEALAVSGVRVIRQPENLGFLRNCNAAMADSRGEYLLLLNNDTVIHAGSLDALLGTFAMRDNVGAVGAMLLSADGTVQEAGGIVWNDGSAWNWGRFMDPEDPRFGYVREVDYCSAAALMVSRSAWAAVDGFDERFTPAYYEDTDLCMALRDAGYSVLYQPESRVTHLEGVSHGTDVGEGVKTHQVRNQAVFADKWRARLAGHAANAVHPELERDRQAVRRILWVEACVLTPDQDSGSLRTLRLFRILLGLGCKITFVADNLLRDEPYVQQLQQEGVEVLYAPHVTSVDKYLREEGGQFDVIALCRHYIAIKYASMLKTRYPETDLWFDTIDLHYLRLQRQYRLDNREATRSLSELAYQEEMEVIGLADVTLVVSDIEVAELARQAPGRRVAVLSNIHEPQGEVPGVEARAGIMFVGGFQHPPNVDAVEYFASDIWPAVRAANPGIEVSIIGSKMPDSLRELGEAAGLNMLGFVDDLTPYYHESMLAIAPLRYGAGVKGKVNQALSFALPVVGSPMAFEGMDVEDGRDVMVAEDAEQFAEAINRVLAEPELWRSLSSNGQASLGREFSTAVARRTVCELLELDDPGEHP